MKPPRHPGQSLRQRLTLLLAGIATIALLVFAGAALVIEAFRARSALVRDAATKAELLAVTLTPAVAFDDPAAATGTLGALCSRANVVAAWLFAEGTRSAFATYTRDHAALALAPPPPAPQAASGHQFTGPWLYYHEPVLNTERARIGTLILQVDPRESRERLYTYSGLLALLLAAVLGLSLPLAARLQRQVSDPVLELAATARRVSERGDYSLRATRRSDDEIGTLVDGFNAMLAQVERSGAALRDSEERLSYALRGATDGLWDWELGTERVYYSPRWKEMLGYTEAELPDTLGTWKRLVHPAQLEPVLAAAADFIAGRAPRFEAEFRMRHKDGHWVDILSRGTVLRDAQGRAARLVGTHVDITELRRSEARLAQAQTIARIGSYEVNPQTGECYWSEEMYRLRQRDRRLGPPRLEEIIETIHPADRERVRAALQRSLREGGDYHEEYRGLLPDGTTRHFQSTAKTERDGHGRVVRFYGTLQDITERVEAEQAMRRSEERYRLLADNADDFVVLNDLAGNRLYVSPSYYRVTGWTPEDFARGDWRARLHPDDLPAVERAHAANLRGETTTIEHRIRCRDGSWLWVELHCKPLPAANGAGPQLLQWSRNITARRQAEEQRDRFFNLSLDLLCVADADGWFRRVNPAFTHVLGFTEQELLARPFLELAVPEDRPIVAAALRQLAAGRDVVAIEARARCQDGSVRVIEWTCPAPPPGVTELFAVGRDVTAQHAAKEALAESEQRFRQLAESIEQVFWMVDLATEQVIYVSPAYEKIWGRPIAALRERPQDWIDGVHPDDREKVFASFLRQRETGYSDDEYRVVQPDGTVRRVHSRAFPVRDASGRLVRLAGIIDDVTAQHAAQEALEDSEKRFRTLAESAPIGIFLSGCDGECRFVNRRWTEITGQSAPAAREFGWTQALHPDDRERVVAEWQAAVREGRESRIEYRFLRPDGVPRWVEGNAAPLCESSGLLVGFVGSVADVTERRDLERQLLAISDRQQARMGQEIHDGLCQQLVGAGFSARALEQRLAELRLQEAADARAVAELVDGAITQAYDLVGGLFPAELAAEGLASALQEFVHRVSRRSAARFAIDYPEPISLDPAQSTHLFRIAQEAVTNALKHARPHRVRLRLLEDEGMVRLTIEDDGAGAAPAAASAGGYGMQMMRYRANLLGGALEVRPLPGGGTAVTCVFRLNPAPAPAPV